MMKEYLARFVQGHGAMHQNNIDFYKDGNAIVKHTWAMGGESKEFVNFVPSSISCFEKLNVEKKT